MLKYEDVLEDKYINSLINSIKSDPYLLNHSSRHIYKVVENVEKISKQLNCDNIFINNIKIAALLHDVGMTVQRKDHAHYSYEIAKKYLDKQNINEKDKNAIMVIKKNIEKTHLEVTLYETSYEKMLKKLNEKLDIIYIDPPYKTNLVYETVNNLINLNLLNSDSLIIVETDEEKRVEQALRNLNVNIIDKRKYGRVYLIFLNKS